VCAPYVYGLFLYSIRSIHLSLRTSSLNHPHMHLTHGTHREALRSFHVRAQLQMLNECTHQNTQTLYKNRNISSRWMRPKTRYRKIKSTSRKSRARSSRRSRQCMLIPCWSALPKRCQKRCACVRDNACESISMSAAAEGFSPTSPFHLFFLTQGAFSVISNT